MNDEREIKVPVWYKNGGMMIRRDCLEPEHPESTYNYIKNLGECPEDFGYYACQLSDEQKDLLASIPNVSFFAELRRRERYIHDEETYGP